MSWRRATALNLAPGASSSEDPQLLLIPPLAPPLYPGDDLHLASRPLPLTALERTTVRSMNVSSPAPSRLLVAGIVGRVDVGDAPRTHGADLDHRGLVDEGVVLRAWGEGEQTSCWQRLGLRL